MTVWLSLTLALFIRWEYFEDVHLIDYCKVPSTLLIQAIDCFQDEKISLLRWTISHENSLNVASSVSTFLKHLLILLVPGKIKSEIKYTLKCSLSWFASLSFSSFQHKLNSKYDIVASLIYEDDGRFIVGRHNSKWYRFRNSHKWVIHADVANVCNLAYEEVRNSYSALIYNWWHSITVCSSRFEWFILVSEDTKWCMAWALDMIYRERRLRQHNSVGTLCINNWKACMIWAPKAWIHTVDLR